MTTARLARLVTACLLVLVSSAPFALSQLKIGSSNTAMADPPVPRPHTVPCKVLLYRNYRFADFTPKSFSYTPPAACPGPWAKVILTADFSVTKGIQFDRTANIWIGPTNIYFGTTSEPDPNTGRSWHLERDLTDYTSIFTTSQAGTVDLGNLVNKTYTGVLHGSATLQFYPLAPGQAPPVAADQVVAFSGGPTGGTVALDTTGSCCQPSLSQTLTFPTNVQALYFDVFAQSQNFDEFWYACVPNDVTTELQSCGNTAFRESEVTIDGVPAGVAPVYPWIFTGGIDPFLWIPIPGVQTMNFVPYRVNLTPFAAMLDDGLPHTIALSVFNADDYFSATASLLLFLDHGSTQVTGGVTQNTLTAPAPSIIENIHQAPNGNISGSVSTSSGHSFQISGYVNTSNGTVTTTISQDVSFSNMQTFKITPSLYSQLISQGTGIHSTVNTKDGAGFHEDKIHYNWPLDLDIVLVFNPDGTVNQTTTISQTYEQDKESRLNGTLVFSNLVQDQVAPTDTLLLDSSFHITGNENQSSSQGYFASDSTGYCYSRNIAAAANVLTSVTNGVGCK